MATRTAAALSKGVREVARPRFVLIGEASHGTHEFYRERAEITRWLIRERGFNAVAAEADWPDAWRVNRYVRGTGDANAALEELGGFERFPTWMWRNLDVLDFAGWLLDKVDPEAAKRARYRYGCLEDFGEDTEAYGYAAAFDLSKDCESEVLAQLVELQRRAADYASRDGRVAADEFFFAEQNARLVRNAEEYYRGMLAGRVSSRNLRDTHMVDTLDALAGHLERQWGRAKIVVWAHNSHLGDARAGRRNQRRPASAPAACAGNGADRPVHLRRHRDRRF